MHQVQLAYAHSTQTVFYIMAGVMAATFLVSVRWMPRGRVEAVDEAQEAPEPGTSAAAEVSVRGASRCASTAQRRRAARARGADDEHARHRTPSGNARMRPGEIGLPHVSQIP